MAGFNQKAQDALGVVAERLVTRYGGTDRERAEQIRRLGAHRSRALR